jgi:hypothetical protein
MEVESISKLDENNLAKSDNECLDTCLDRKENHIVYKLGLMKLSEIYEQKAQNILQRANGLLDQIMR